MSNAFILAAGKAERHNGGNKPLLKVGDETLLERMVRQIRPHVRTVWIVSHRDDLHHPDCLLTKPSSHDYICDTLLSSSVLWDIASKTIILLGDVYYTDAAMLLILGNESNVMAFGQKHNIHALSIPYQQAFWMMGALTSFRDLVRDKPAKYGHGKLYAFCDWARIRKVPLFGEATDIDSPQEHKRLLAKLQL